MSVIFLLILVSLSVALIFLAAFLWAVKDGQYEDDYSPAVRMLFDDEPPAFHPTPSNAINQPLHDAEAANIQPLPTDSTNP